MIRRIAFVAVLLASHAALNGQGSIATTKHNLSVGGPGTVRAQSETQICVFCHTPHNSRTQAPLWNRNDSGGTYTMYWSATMDAYSSPAAAPQPNGNSKLCLSCHDGTLALGATVASGTIPMSGWRLREEFAAFDAEKRFDVESIQTKESPLCIAGQILVGMKKPHDCSAFGKECTPEHPLGATMVSSEGACAAYYKYKG